MVNVETDEIVQKWTTPIKGEMGSLVSLQDGKVAAIPNRDGDVILISTEDGSLLRQEKAILRFYAEPVAAPDGESAFITTKDGFLLQLFIDPNQETRRWKIASAQATSPRIPRIGTNWALIRVHSCDSWQKSSTRNRRCLVVSSTPESN